MHLAKTGKNNFINYFFVVTILFIHFDPIGIKITIPFLFIFFLSLKLRISNSSIFYFAISSIYFILIFFNYFNDDKLDNINFLKTLSLFIFSLFYHIYFCTSINLNNIKINYNYINLALAIIFFISALQFVSFNFFGVTLFFNLFGKFSYTNQYDLELLFNGPTRVTAFYLEPSYLALVVIHIYLFLLILDKINLFNFVAIISILIFSGSRGGFIFFLLFLLYFILYSKDINFKKKILVACVFLVFLVFILLTSDSFSILSPDNISTVNTSQFDRIYLGYIFSEIILQNHPSGIPLGQIEFYFSKFFGIDGSLFSFYYLLIAYFGYFGLVSLAFIYLLIFLKFNFRVFIFLFIYLLMYFNLTGSLLAPDTYFWFVIFIVLFRRSLNEV